MSEPEAIDQSKAKIGIFGGGGVGKTALTLQFLRGQFVEEYIPTLADDFAKDITVDGKPIHLEIIDTAGQDDFRQMRASFYSSVQGFLIVYSVIERNSLFEAEEIYKDILACLNKEAVPCVLAGNKADIKDETSVSTEDGQGMAKTMGAKFFETSARTGQNVKASFDEAVRAVKRMVFGVKEQRWCCTVM
jgi:small GTP-binding protein